MADNREAVIISAARTPTGKFQGALKGFTAPELGAIAIKEAVNRSGVDPAKVDEVIMGCGRRLSRRAFLRKFRH
jgi:acetyl-CoA C-acetyltransferase